MERRAFLGLKAAKTGGGGSSAAANTYIRLPTTTAAVMRTNGQRGVLSIEAGVDVADAALRGRAQQSVPRLRDAWSVEAQRFAAVLRPGAPPDVEALGRALQSATDRVLGRAGARVLLGTVMAV